MSRIKRHKIKSAGLKSHKSEGMSRKAILTLILGGVMVFSIFGIMFSSYNSGSEEVEYGDYSFQRTSDGWSVEIDGKDIGFSYLPQDLEELDIDSALAKRLLDSRVIYVTFDPNSEMVSGFELVRFELGNTLSQLFGTYVMPGIENESVQYSQQPLVDCGNATSSVPVVRLTESNTTEASIKGNCITLQSTEYSALALKDRLLYAMLGIME